MGARESLLMAMIVSEPYYSMYPPQEIPAPVSIADLRAKNPDAPPEALEAKIREILKQRLDAKIEEKLVVLHAKRTLPAENFLFVQDDVTLPTLPPRLLAFFGRRADAASTAQAVGQ